MTAESLAKCRAEESLSGWRWKTPARITSTRASAEARLEGQEKEMARRLRKFMAEGTAG
jgi:hypothetical protein